MATTTLTREGALTADQIESHLDSFLSSPSLDPAWVAGWHAAVRHVAAAARKAPAEVHRPRWEQSGTDPRAGGWQCAADDQEWPCPDAPDQT